MAIIKPSHRLERILETFSENQLRLIMDNLGAIQLTEGCSSACPDCGVGALPGVRDFIPFNFLEKLFSKFSEQLSRQIPLLYFASEPFDYCDGKHTYEDVHASFEKKIGRSPQVITSLPKGKEKKILEYALKGSPLGDTHNPFVHALSITRLNYPRIERCLLEMIPQLEPDNQLKIASSYQLKICSRYDEITKKTLILSSAPTERLVLNLDDIVRQLSIKDKTTFYLNGINSTTTIHSLWDTPSFDFTDERCRRGQAMNLPVPKYCSINPENTALSNGKGNLYIVRLPNKDYLASESKPVSVNMLFDYLRYINFDNSARGTSIRDYRNKRRSEQVHSLMLGPKAEELSPTGIGCFHGAILTPSGAYNLQTRIPTRYYPYGLRVIPISPDNFNVAEYLYLYSVNKKNISHMAKRFRLLKQ